MRPLILLLLMLLPLPAFSQTLTEIRMEDGRSYLFARPAGDGAAPLIVALHGGGGNPRQFARNSGLPAAAIRAGFAIALPLGTGRLPTWNGGYCCGAAARTGVDDIAFLDRVARDASLRAGTTGKIFVTGMSNGAIMAQTWAAARPATIAAVVSVAGTMDADRVRVRGPVPILHIHGTADEMVPFDGGQGNSSLTRTDFAAAEDALARFRAPFGPMRQMHQAKGNVTRTSWVRNGRVQVALLTIRGGAHEWPSGRRADGTDVDATAEVIDFFSDRK